MAKNRLIDLNDILFEQLKSLGGGVSDNLLDQERIAIEVKKATATSRVASQIISNARLMLEASKLVQTGADEKLLPEILSKKKASEL